MLKHNLRGFVLKVLELPVVILSEAKNLQRYRWRKRSFATLRMTNRLLKQSLALASYYDENQQRSPIDSRLRAVLCRS